MSFVILLADHVSTRAYVALFTTSKSADTERSERGDDSYIIITRLANQ